MQAALARRDEAADGLADLLSGARPEEVAVLDAARARAAADLALARSELQRQRELRERGVVPEAALDRAQSDYGAAQAREAEAEARIVEARLPARESRIEQARDALAVAEADVKEARWHLRQRRVMAPAAARVEDVLHEPGETASAGDPVVVLIPEGGVFVRFFVPEPRLASFPTGGEVALSCSGCAEGLRGRIRFVADEVEFAPPVIFSQERQDKLVFMVEATVLGGGPGPRPGQPVTVRLADGAR